ncbi:MAG TPA: 2Fe-2S iron-sulfur cluster-binding protein [Polyangia bacterium]
MPTITFAPMNVTIECAPGESLFDVARRNGVPVATACAGKATCGLCRMKVLDGEANLTPFNAGERKHLGNVYFITKERLSCQARVTGGAVSVLVPLSRLPVK